MAFIPFSLLFFLLIVFAEVPIASASALMADRIPPVVPDRLPENPQTVIPPRNPIPEAPLPEQPLPPLPPPDELLTPPALPAAPEAPGDVPATLFVNAFLVEGSTVFSAEDFAKVTAPFTGRELFFAELLQVRTQVTQLYVKEGYLRSCTNIINPIFRH